MDCKRMEGVILSDYIDGNLKGDALKELESHLVSCPNCRALAEEAASTVRLFRAAPRQETPSGVWQKILAETRAAPQGARVMEDAFERMRYVLSHLRPAVVTVSAATLVLIILTVMRFAPHKDYLQMARAQDDIIAISSLNGEGDDPGYDLGTPAEQFFL